MRRRAKLASQRRDLELQPEVVSIARTRLDAGERDEEVRMQRFTLTLSIAAIALVACGGSSSDQRGSSGGGGAASSANGGAPGTGGVSAGGSGGSAGSANGGGGSGAASACAAAKVGPNGDLNGYRMFPADHPFNTDVSGMPTSAHSDDWLANCSSVPRLQLYPGMPYNVVPKNTPPVTATNLQYNSKPYPNPWPFPADALIEGGDPTTPGDHHCLAFDVGDCKLYEVYNILWAPDHQSFTAVSGTVWDTTKNDPGSGSGSDAAGMPITPILLRYQEVFVTKKVEHALRFTCEFTEEGHIAPARASAASTGGSGKPADPHDLSYPPMGMRVRLKASYDPTAHGYPPWIVTVLDALKTYGMILADNGGSGTPLAFEGDSSQDFADGVEDDAYLLKSIGIDELEVVDTGAVTQD
jgi:hypothetical protein